MTGGQFRWLDLDIENRPLNYVGQDFTFSDVTVIAAGWADEEEVHVWVQTKRDGSRRSMLKNFAKLYEQADGVTGHFFRSHDLPTLCGAMIEHGLPPLSPKLSCDTKNDLVKHKSLGASQGYLAELLGIEAPKVGMGQLDWRSANRLTKAGIELAKIRCVGDVIQHKALRLRLVELGLLSSPKVWRPDAKRF